MYIIKICIYWKAPLNVIIFIFSILSLIFISGCTDISDINNISEHTLISKNASTDYNVFDEVSPFNHSSDEVANVQIIENDDVKTDYSESYSTYTFTDFDETLISTMIFVGDSICNGIPMLNKSQVIAYAEASSKNIMDIKFKMENGETDIITALVNAAPDIVIISLGLNDLNVSSEDDFCNNYIRFISMIRIYCPNSHIITLSIAPVHGANEFTDDIINNTSINKFNDKLEKAILTYNDNAVSYLDISPELQNSNGELKSKYTTGDNTSLTDAAYYAILWQICGFIRK